MKIYKTAFTTDQNRKKIDDQEKEIKDLKAKLRKLETELGQTQKQIDSLNIGQRRYWQQKSIFTSLQRKVERFEKMETEWQKYKGSIDDQIKREVEKRSRAQVKGGSGNS